VLLLLYCYCCIGIVATAAHAHSTPLFFIFLSSLLLLLYVCSFASDCHLVVDATVVLSVQPTTSTGVENVSREVLYPARHQMTLPLNQLNIMFSDFSVAANHHTRLDSDR
jgi:hypothetical protein